VLSPETRDRADVLRRLLDAGDLADLPPVDVGADTVTPFAIAVRIALADLDQLTAQARAGMMAKRGRWHRLAVQIRGLYERAVGTHEGWPPRPPM
jgi:hypothetical protein